MKKIVFLVSGSGGSLNFIYNALAILNIDIEIVGVLADRECRALDFAVKRGLFSQRISYNRKNTEELQFYLEKLQPDIIITNIHKIIDDETLNMFPNQFINLHYSLLPSFGGLFGMDTVKQAEANNVGFIGGTCHLVDEIMDGGKVIQQACFPVNWKSDVNTIDTVFKASSICLLAGIFFILGIESKKSNMLIINNKSVLFSPSLPFDQTLFESKIWNFEVTNYLDANL